MMARGGSEQQPVPYTACVVRARRRQPVGERPRRHDEIRGATVPLTGWSTGREHEIAAALGATSREPVDLDAVELPFVALPKGTLEKAEAARGLLIEAGGSVDLRDEWVTRDAPRPIGPGAGG